MSDELRNKLKETTEFLKGKGVEKPEIGVILGSGLNDYADRMDDPLVIPYNDIPNMQAGKLSDHRGQLIYGSIAGKKVILLAGRFHYYENGDMQKTAYPARVLVALGVKRFIITNAAGCINENYSAGDLMLISDHINYSGANPLIGDNLDEFGPRFPDMTYTYNIELREALKNRAHEEGINLREGVYMMFSGPTFETPAEIRFARTAGADAAGMSTVPEAIIANHAGCEVIGISFLSNMAAGVLDQPLSGQEVTEAAKHIKSTFEKVVDMAIAIEI
ncbi:MAG: purine-nucleoside phosphorylase [Mogibacterium sp.]|nr:purine-nucleoside phosphorylase [Mogibacterium sp.]